MHVSIGILLVVKEQSDHSRATKQITKILSPANTLVQQKPGLENNPESLHLPRQMPKVQLQLRSITDVSAPRLDRLPRV